MSKVLLFHMKRCYNYFKLREVTDMNDKITKEQLVKKILDNDRSLDDSNISEELLHELISGKI